MAVEDPNGQKRDQMAKKETPFQLTHSMNKPHYRRVVRCSTEGISSQPGK